MKNYKEVMKVAAILLVIGGLVAFIGNQNPQNQPQAWEFPVEYSNKENAVKADEASIKDGQALYTQCCKACHGKTGINKRGTLDLTNKKYKENTDGELYYMSFIGRVKMHDFTKRVQDEQDRWSVVNYLRTLVKEQ